MRVLFFLVECVVVIYEARTRVRSLFAKFHLVVYCGLAGRCSWTLVRLDFPPVTCLLCFFVADGRTVSVGFLNPMTLGEERMLNELNAR